MLGRKRVVRGELGVPCQVLVEEYGGDTVSDSENTNVRDFHVDGPFLVERREDLREINLIQIPLFYYRLVFRCEVLDKSIDSDFGFVLGFLGEHSDFREVDLRLRDFAVDSVDGKRAESRAVRDTRLDG